MLKQKVLVDKEGKTEITDLDSALKRVAELELLLEKADSSRENLTQKAIIDQSPVGISVRDRNGNLILCNTKWVEIWEMTDAAVATALARRRDTLRMDVKDNYLGSNRRSVVDVYKNGGDLILGETYVARLKKWLNQRFYGIKDQSGNIESVVVLTEDVTEKRRTKAIEEELRETTRRYHTLVKNLPVAAYTTDFAGQVISANPAMVKMFLVDSEEDLYSSPVRKRYKNPADRELFLSELKNNGKVDNYEVELVRDDGTGFWASVSATVTMDNSGEIYAIDGIIRDISTVKALEAEMLKAQKLESIGILAGGIAHDFNNIMAVVLGNISLAKQYSVDNRKALEKLSNAENASLRASKLTRQLLTFSKGGKPVRYVTNIQGNLLEAASFAATGSEVKILYYMPEDLWTVDIDQVQIGQVVNNLVINAIQATPCGGVIEITAENVHLDKGIEPSLEPGQYIRITIEDNGIGILPELHNKIFDPYFTTKPKGSGLGLAAAYSIIRNHGGFISFESEQGNGSKFFFYLPAASSSVEHEKAELIVDDGFISKQAKILVMDDEEPILDVVTEILQKNGYSTGRSSNGKEAVDLYRKALDEDKKYDLVIMDITVPGGIGGVEALKMLVEIDPLVKAIVASGYSNNMVMANYNDFGFVDSMTKPFTIETLLSTVRNSLNSNVGSNK